jgi:hypothetical protein
MTEGVDVIRLRRQLQAWVDELALQGQHAEHALVHPVQRFFVYEALQCLDAKRELSDGQRPLVTKVPLAKPFQVLGSRALRAVDEPEVLTAA